MMVLRVFYRSQREGVEIVGRVALLLPSVRVQYLPEVALLIKQAEPDQRIILIAAGLDMVAGENPEAARVDRQALGKSILRGEVGDQLTVLRDRLFARARVIHVAGRAIDGHVARVVGGALQSSLRDTAQHEHGVVAA